MSPDSSAAISAPRPALESARIVMPASSSVVARSPGTRSAGAPSARSSIGPQVAGGTPLGSRRIGLGSSPS